MKKNSVRTLFWMSMILIHLQISFADEPAKTTGDKSASGSSKISVTNILTDEVKLTDPRNGKLRSTRDSFHPWAPSKNLADWEKESDFIKKRILVSNGLWPMPSRGELKPAIYGKVDRGDYTVEKVYFASHPGHYVTGNLYRPSNLKGKVPGILCPHGHWPEGRFYHADEKKAKGQIEKGAEKLMPAAQYPVQARMVQLVRMGCVVFHYDMVGYADSRQINHTEGFRTAEAGLHLQNFMGLQTFNSIRALDFLSSLSEVDTKRLAVTGSSGGGTQTFLLCAIDDRPSVAFPAVMVSTGMQGGCICENASYLRQGINNIALAAVFAPKPMAMSGADDWTKEIETKGYPELQQIYGFYGKKEDVLAKAYPQFKHNYNYVARTMMYKWMKKYLKMEESVSTEEKEFKPLSVEEMSLFSDEKKLPADKVSPEELRQYLTKTSREKFQKMIPETKEQLDKFKDIVKTAAQIMLCKGVPDGDLIESKAGEPTAITEGIILVNGIVSRKDTQEQVPFSFIMPREGFQNSVIIWLEDEGKSCLFKDDKTLRPEIQKLVEKGQAIISLDLYLTGEWVADKPLGEKYAVDQKYHGYTYCFNRPILSSRVNDVMSIIAGLYKLDFVYEINLVGRGKAGVTALLARAIAGKYITRTIADVEGFHFQKVNKTSDELYLPGALKYGGIGGLGALIAPNHLVLAGTDSIAESELSPLRKVYQVTEGNFDEKKKSLSRQEIVDLLLE